MDADEPIKKPGMVIGENLEAISVAELEQRLVALDSESARIRAEITKKQASKAAASAFFKS
ncbi:DUF1192 family protein [Aestuariivirga litoralis]|uniref:DUF1192 family protein n=1 Tax=Aestuariivirga litoralis TaxID=2650924 RepID=UPI0018C700E2|nr:DUF1192 family protein [Aestuariivirga litoralis]MBG1233113.1 DUF1192 domain-containing protein [Aestuariivirga litoralis]